MIKNCIITPTFEPHFVFVEKMLKSMEKYVVDKKDIPIFFTINAREQFSFQEMIEPYKNSLDIRMVLFEEILEYYGIDSNPEQLLKKYGKFSFQTLKKFYTMLYVDAEHYLVLDSETMWIRETNITQMFEEYFEHPFISGSTINKYLQSDFNKYINENITYLLNYESDLWFLENFVWYYDKVILNDLFNEIGTPIDAIEKVYQKIKKVGNEKGIGVFEIALYQNYVYKNHKKYKYVVNRVNDICLDYLGEKEYYNYYKKLFQTYDGNCGFLERVAVLLSKENYESLAKMFKDYKFNIIRCDQNYDIYELQKKFFDIVKPNILAASQDHFFGCNEDKKMIKRFFAKRKFNEVYWKIKNNIINHIPILRRRRGYWEAVKQVGYIHWDLYLLKQEVEKCSKYVSKLMKEDNKSDDGQEL